MGLESFGLARFDLRTLVQGQMRIVKRKSDYNLFIIRSRRF